MKRHLFGCAAAGILALASSVVAAQNPPYSPPSSDRTPAVQDKASAVTVEGCLMREQDVPGRSPNIAEKAGMGEDYILASAKVIKGTAPAMAEPKAGEAVGTSGTNAPMYDVKGIDDEQLKPLVGQRVQVEGTFDRTEHSAMGATKDKDSMQDFADLHGTVIRHVEGECPVK